MQVSRTTCHQFLRALAATTQSSNHGDNQRSNFFLSALRAVVKMMTKFLTEVSAKFNPFSVGAKPARLFLTYLPPNARATGMAIKTTMLPRSSKEPSSLRLKFSMLPFHNVLRWRG